LTQAKRALTNEIRLAQGLPPLPEDADPAKETSEEENDKDNKASDILLRESALILNDLVMISGNQANGVRSAKEDEMQQLNVTKTDPIVR
jgi:hypothetical protein